MGAANDILASYQHVVSELRLTNGTGGVFDVVVDGETIYSKHLTGRYAEPGEVLRLFVDHIGSDVRRYVT